MAARMRALDWSKTPLGPVGAWPPALRITVGLVLASPLPSILLWAPTLTVAAYNDAYRPFLGRKPEALGHPVTEVWPDAWDVIGPQIRRTLAGETLTFEAASFTLDRGAGPEEAWFDYSFYPVRDEAGEIVGVLNVGVETTARVRAEQARLASERRLKEAVEAARLSSDFRALFEATPIPLLAVAPPDWTIVAANDERLRVTGARREDQIGQRLFDLYPDDPDDPAADGVRNLTASLGRVLATRATDVMPVQRYAVRDEDGRFRERWWSPVNTPVLGADGEVALVIHRVEEVTDIVRLRGEAAARDQMARDQQAVIDRLRGAEAALREREERLRLIVEGARDYAILATDPSGRIETWLPGAAAVFGWSAEEAVGQPVGITFTPGDRAAGVPASERETARRDGRAPNTRWHQRQDGSRVCIEGATTALRGPDGRIRGFLLMGQDVTARKVAEERQALMAREVDHRAKNALSVVQAALRLTRAPDLPSYVRALEGRVAALARAQTLLADDRWSGADVLVLLRGELAPFLNEGGGPTVELSGPDLALPPTAAQPFAMAVHELATNAVKYGALSVPGGRVAVAWRVVAGHPGGVRFRWTETGGPPVERPPEARGFGTRVLDGTVRRQLGGTVSMTWERSGLVCELEVPLLRGEEVSLYNRTGAQPDRPDADGSESSAPKGQFNV